jgi:hypothetical protein
MRFLYIVLCGILIAITVFQYKQGYVRGWSFMRQGRKRTRADNPVAFWAILMAEIIGAVYLLIRAAY